MNGSWVWSPKPTTPRRLWRLARRNSLPMEVAAWVTAHGRCTRGIQMDTKENTKNLGKKGGKKEKLLDATQLDGKETDSPGSAGLDKMFRLGGLNEENAGYSGTKVSSNTQRKSEISDMDCSEDDGDVASNKEELEKKRSELEDRWRKSSKELKVVVTNVGSEVRKAKKRRRSQESDQMGLNEEEELSKMKNIVDNISEYMIRDDAKISKLAGANLLREIRNLEDIVVRVLCENSKLKGRINECEKINAEIRKCGMEVNSSGIVGNINTVRRNDVVNDVNGGVMNIGPGEMSEMSRFQPPVRSYAVVVKSRIGEVAASQVKKKIVEGVGNKLKVRVKGIRELKDGTVVIETPSAVEKEELLKNECFKKCGLQVVEPRKICPKIIVYDVSKDISDDMMLDEIYRKNLRDVIEVNDYEKKVRVVGRNRQKTGDLENVILEVTPQVRDKLVQDKRVYMMWTSHRVNIYERVNRCFGCYGYGHRLNECKKQRLCVRCGKAGHKGKDCKHEVSCNNCKEKGNLADHSVLSFVCPEYVWRIERLRARVYDE